MCGLRWIIQQYYRYVNKHILYQTTFSHNVPYLSSFCFFTCLLLVRSPIRLDYSLRALSGHINVPSSIVLPQSCPRWTICRLSLGLQTLFASLMEWFPGLPGSWAPSTLHGVQTKPLHLASFSTHHGLQKVGEAPSSSQQCTSPTPIL